MTKKASLKNELSINFDNIPDALKNLKIWSPYNYEQVFSDSLVPTPKTIKNENINPNTKKGLITFEVCKKNAHKFDGIGISITRDDPFMIFRIDDCCDMESGFMDENAQKVLDGLNSYSEYTLNKRGLIIIVKPNIHFCLETIRLAKHTLPNGDEVREIPFEFQDLSVSNQDKFLPITGNQVPGTPKMIHARKKACEKLFEDIPPAVVLKNFEKAKNVLSMLSDNYLTYIFYLYKIKKNHER